MDRRNLPIAVLAVTAAVLLLGLVVVDSLNRPVVYAGSMQGSGGDYAATIMRLSDSEEVLWIIDARSRVAGVYEYDSNSGRLVLRDQINVATLPMR